MDLCVELEFVFAFHEDQVNAENVIGQNGLLNEIRKDISWDIRAHDPDQVPFPFTPLPPDKCPHYNSWGIQKFSRITGIELPAVQPYHLQPLRLLRNKLRSAITPISVKVDPTYVSGLKPVDQHSNSKWTIMLEHTVNGVRSTNIPKRLTGKGISAFNAEKWDSYGLEVSSPVFRVSSRQGDALVQSMTDALKSEGDPSSQFGAFITNQ